MSRNGNDYTENGVPYTLMQYFTWLETNGTDKEKAVGAAAKDYCAAAQIYFNYNNPGDLSLSGAVGTVTEDMLSGYAADREGTLPTGVSIKGITAMLESDNTLRLYLGFKGVSPEGLTFAIDGTPATPEPRSNMYYLAMDKGVLSNHLQEAHSYTVSDGTNTYTVTASVLTFARSYVINGNQKEQNLGKALYLYNRAAVEAFSN